MYHASACLAQQQQHHDWPRPAVRALRDYLGKLQTKGVPLLSLQLLLVHAADVALHEAAPN
jgi:hypothetical protein